MYDVITDIRFTSTSKGWVTTLSTDSNSANGGAVFGVNGTTLSVLASGTAIGGFDQGLDFFGVYAGNSTSQEVIAAGEMIGMAGLSTNGGSTFAYGSTGSGFENSANAALGFTEDSAGNWYVADVDGGHLYKAAATPGSSTAWNDITPPAATCDAPSPSHGDPHSGGDGMTLYVSPDGKTIVYPLAYTTAPLGVCVTHNGGTSWAAVIPPNPPPAAMQPQGYDIYATAGGTLFLYAGDDLDGDISVVYRSTDGGTSFTQSTIPTQGSTLFSFDRMFFAPDNMTGWIIGRTSMDDAAPTPLLFKTTDGGVTWKDITVQSFTGSVVDPVQGGPWMHVGFALDANNIWIGGYNGTLLHNGNGGL